MKQTAKSILLIGGFFLMYFLLSVGSAELSSYSKANYVTLLYLDIYQECSALIMGIAFGFLIFYLRKRAEHKKEILIALFSILLLLSLSPYLLLFCQWIMFTLPVFQQFNKLLFAFTGISLLTVIVTKSERI